MANNRETMRDALVTLLTAALVGEGLPCAAVYSYLIGRIPKSPSVVVSSGGVERQRIAKNSWTYDHYLNVEVFVKWKDSANWAGDDAEDKIDEIERLIAGVQENNQSTANWSELKHASRSVVDVINIGGTNYRRESIFLVAAGPR